MANITSRGLAMTETKMDEFINNIGRAELYEEIGGRTKKKRHYPKYLKAVRASLIALGYDEEWVETTFCSALDAKYLDGKYNGLDIQKIA